MRRSFLFAALPAVFLLTAANQGCEDSSSDGIQRKQQERLSLQATQQAGMPAIVNFQERKTLKEIFELRDTALSTVTYITDLNGHLHKVCDSIGYGIPYATQYTNPQRIEAHGAEGITTLPQADPNGLFSPASASGTWVTCLNPQTQKAAAIYIEPHVIVSPFPLDVK